MQNNQQSTPEIGYWRDDKTSPLAVARRRAVWALVGNCFCCVLFTVVWGFCHLSFLPEFDWPWIGFQCLGALLLPPVMSVVILLVKRISISFSFSTFNLAFYWNVYRIQGFIFIQYVFAKIFSMYATRSPRGSDFLADVMLWIGVAGYLASLSFMVRQVIYDDASGAREVSGFRVVPRWPLRLILLTVVYYLYILSQYALEELRASAGC